MLESKGRCGSDWRGLGASSCRTQADEKQIDGEGRGWNWHFSIGFPMTFPCNHLLHHPGNFVLKPAHDKRRKKTCSVMPFRTRQQRFADRASGRLRTQKERSSAEEGRAELRRSGCKW